MSATSQISSRSPFDENPVRLESSRMRATLPPWVGGTSWAGRRSGARFWMCAAFCGALAIAVTVSAVAGTGEQGAGIALHLTGRFSFLLFWPAYAGGAMATLFAPHFGKFAGHGRDFGLAYASAQLVHFGLVARLICISGRPVMESIMPFFAIGIVWTYVLALSSLERLSDIFSPKHWRFLRAVGLEYLALVFFADLVLLPVRSRTRHPLEYLPFSILKVVGSLLRLAASVPNQKFVY